MRHFLQLAAFSPLLFFSQNCSSNFAVRSNNVVAEAIPNSFNIQLKYGYGSGATPTPMPTATCASRSLLPNYEYLLWSSTSGGTEGADSAVDVRTFGVHGDGVIDDTEAIQNAVASSSVLFFPAGVYVVSGPIHLKSQGVYYGAGANQSVLLYTGPAQQSVLSLDGTSGSVIHDLGVIGTTTTFAAGVGIDFGNSSSNIVHHVYVSNFWTFCVNIDGTGNTLQDSDLESCRFVVNARGDSHTIRNNFISNHYLSSAETKPWTNASNYWDGICGEGLTNSFIVGNTVVENGQSGIYTGGNWSVSFGNTIENNYVARNWNRGIDQGVTGDVTATNSLSNETITGNVVIDNREMNIWLDFVHGATITGNYLEYTSNYATLFGASAEPAHASIFLAETGGTGLAEDQLTAVTVTGNTLLDDQNGTCLIFGVTLGAGSSVTGNNLNCRYWYPDATTLQNVVGPNNSLCSPQ